MPRACIFPQHWLRRCCPGTRNTSLCRVLKPKPFGLAPLASQWLAGQPPCTVTCCDTQGAEPLCLLPAFDAADLGLRRRTTCAWRPTPTSGTWWSTSWTPLVGAWWWWCGCWLCPGVWEEGFYQWLTGSGVCARLPHSSLDCWVLDVTEWTLAACVLVRGVVGLLSVHLHSAGMHRAGACIHASNSGGVEWRSEERSHVSGDGE